MKLRIKLQTFLSILKKTRASKAKATFMKKTLVLLENIMSSSVPCSNVLGEIIDIRLNIDVTISMIRVTDVMAKRIKTNLVKRRSAFLVSIWLPVRSPCLSITCLNLKTETLFNHKSMNTGITNSRINVRKKSKYASLQRYFSRILLVNNFYIFIFIFWL